MTSKHPDSEWPDKATSATSMKPRAFRPSRRLLVGISIIALMLLISEMLISEMLLADDAIAMSWAIPAVLSLCLLIVLGDLVLSWIRLGFGISRRVPANLSLGQWVEVRLDFNHQLGYPVHGEISDHCPDGFDHEYLPVPLVLNPGQASSVVYRVKPNVRGQHRFSGLDYRRPSLIGLWQIYYHFTLQTSVRVYPNFSSIAGYALLAAESQTMQLGIRKKPRRGEGMDFHQLREYREGDSLRQVDWKATSRLQKFISREYQDARDQQVIVMLDSGRRMRTQDQTLSHFDHSLNALLLLSHIALHQGDSVGVLSFGAEQRWVPPLKGVTNVNTLLNSLYDLYPSNQASDYLNAAQSLISRQRKRSLVILVSTLRDEDTQDLLIAIRLLQKNHLVLVANLYEEAIHQAEQAEINGFESALRHAGVRLYQQQTRDAIDRLSGAGAWVVTCRPAELAVTIVNSYLQIKHAGSL